MRVGSKQSMQQLVAFFDELAAMPKPRIAIACFFGLPLLGMVAIIIGVALLVQFVSWGAASLNFSTTIIEPVVLMLSLGTAFAGFLVWLDLIFKARDFAIVLGNSDK